MYLITIIISLTISISSFVDSVSQESFKFETRPSEMYIYNPDDNQAYLVYPTEHVDLIKEADSNLMHPYH